MVKKNKDITDAKTFGFSNTKEFRKARTLIGSLIVEARNCNEKAEYKLIKLLHENPKWKPMVEHLTQKENLDEYKSNISAKEFSMFRGHKSLESIRIMESAGAPGLGKKS